MLSTRPARRATGGSEGRGRAGWALRSGQRSVASQLPRLHGHQA